MDFLNILSIVALCFCILVLRGCHAIMRHFIQRLLLTWIVKRSYDFVERMPLEDAASISSIISNPEIQKLQHVFAVYESSGYSYLEVLAILTNSLANSESEKSLKNYLRSCLQLLITYSICTANKEWTLQKGIVTFKKHAATLERLLSVPRVFIPYQISLPNCLLRANLLETEAELALLRVSIIRQLYELSLTVEPHLKYEAFDFNNQDHVRNASDLYKRMRIKSQPHTLTSTAFSLVINPLPLTDTLLLSPPSYADQDAVKSKEKNVNECTSFL